MSTAKSASVIRVLKRFLKNYLNNFFQIIKFLQKVTVQRWPETLIVYLKRFVYLSTPHPHAKKIETEVIFDHQNLDVSNLSSDLSRHHYDLVGSIQVRKFI